jgi:hypothetical protein
MKRYMLIFALILLTGCMGGQMKGVTSDAQSVTMNYDQKMDYDVYSIHVDGEHFEGKAVMVDATTTFGTAFGSAYSQYGSAVGTTNVVGFTGSGKFKAVLLGSRGNTLRCLMNYADSSGFTSAGGVGECIHSDGRRIDLVW